MTKRLAPLLLGLLLAGNVSAATRATGLPHSTDNDDSCDIALLPAATLLVPYFEVDITTPAGAGETSVITVTNVSNQEQIARVTLWTDRAYPVLSFNVYLTGYDVQSLNLYDIIVLGQIAPPVGTGFEDFGSPGGEYSDPNPVVVRETCRNLPMNLHPLYVERMKQAFTIGRVPAIGSVPACNEIGGVHANATGYVTIDVVRTCTGSVPTDNAYFTDEILFDNVLVGDYEQVNRSENFAEGSPMVHIRAIPEGGTAAQRAAAPQTYQNNFPQTFYGRFQSTASPTFDSRQPLPSLFAGRWISGGTGSFVTEMKIWRDGQTGRAAGCDAYAANGRIVVSELVRFDEDENPFIIETGIADPPLPYTSLIPAAAKVDIDDREVFPAVENGAVAGWLFLNLDNVSQFLPNQAWIVSSMRAEGRYSVDADVVALGNGCTPATSESEIHAGNTVIGPAGNINPAEPLLP